MAILNKTIYIDNIITKFASTGNEGFTIISGKDKYTFYRRVKGEDGEVYKAFQSMNVKPKDTVNIGYIEEPSEFTNDQGQLVKFTKRSLISIRESGSLPIPPTQKSTPQSNSSDDFGRRLTLYGMVNGRLAAGADIESISKELPQLSLLADEIEVIAKRPSSMNLAQTKIMKANETTEEEPLPEELPIIQQEDEVYTDDIPF